jgi:syntaxin 6
MQSEAVKTKYLADERSKAIRRAGPDSLGATTDEERHNTNHIIDSQARTSLLFQHQEETLDDLDAAVTRVGHMAENINEEIGNQSKMLDEMAEDLDNVEQELGLVMGKLAKFLHTKDKWQLGTILLLTMIAIVLFLLVLYT